MNIGKFKEQATSNSAWLPVLKSKVPEPRPGTCVDDTSNLPDTVLNFIRSHPLMDKAVNHEHSNPVFYKRDLVFTKLVVDKIKIDLLNQEVNFPKMITMENVVLFRADAGVSSARWISLHTGE